jgi:6-phospho-3-hexuloisomerase
MVGGVASETQFGTNARVILGELDQLLARVNEAQVQDVVAALIAAPRIFVAGAGRSGLAIRMVAMRLMHLGLVVHVAGETTAPASGRGDLLLVASGSGTTFGAVHAAEVAVKAGAEVLAITAARDSKLASLAKWILEVPAATKLDHGKTLSQQYAGALFEQAVLLTMDAIFHQMWQDSHASAEQLYQRHANLE